ncbi:hypothetical protein FOPE_04444 [Fonsecaea pedrosoi]|nr:hypothetical protein FOPE_04444 [Fonsecaea pedrosoi]
MSMDSEIADAAPQYAQPTPCISGSEHILEPPLSLTTPHRLIFGSGFRTRRQILTDQKAAADREFDDWCRQEEAAGPRPSQPDPYDPFFIPDSILLYGPVSPQRKSRLLQLPHELLTDIFKRVKIPHFQVSLALTCKTMARVAAEPGIFSPWRGYRDKDGLFRLLERRNNFIPPHLKLCRACFRFLPWSGGEYWDRQMSSGVFDRSNLNWYDILMWFYNRVAFQYRCPWCCVFQYTSYASQGLYERRRVNGPLGLLDTRERVCPDLNRRMDKP